MIYLNQRTSNDFFTFWDLFIKYIQKLWNVFYSHEMKNKLHRISIRLVVINHWVFLDSKFFYEIGIFSKIWQRHLSNNLTANNPGVAAFYIHQSSKNLMQMRNILIVWMNDSTPSITILQRLFWFPTKLKLKLRSQFFSHLNVLIFRELLNPSQFYSDHIFGQIGFM